MSTPLALISIAFWTPAAQLAPPAPENPRLPSPLVAVPEPGLDGELHLRLDPGLRAELEHARRATVIDFPLPGGGLVDLELEQRAWRGIVGTPVLDGAQRSDLGAAMDLTVWRGSVRGDAGSKLYLGLSREGCHGWLHCFGELYLVRGRRAPDGTWSGGHCTVVRTTGPQASAAAGPTGCATPPSPPGAREGRGEVLVPSSGGLRHLRAAVSADFWVNQAFGGNTGAELVYVYQLLWSVSDWYQSQLPDVILTFPYVELWTTEDDPWDSPDPGYLPDEQQDLLLGAVLGEFNAKWAGIHIQQKTKLALLLCGQKIGGGMASGVGPPGALCGFPFEPPGEWSIMGGIDGGLSSAMQLGSLVWEFKVLAHEIGHNLGAIHTHDLGIDDCNADETSCPPGTIMSYCQTCSSSGVGNIVPAFHLLNLANITANLAAAPCIPFIGGDPLHVSDTPGPFIPQGTELDPFTDLFEALRVGTLAGGPAATLRLRGDHPGSAPGAQVLPPLLLDAVMLSGGNVRLERWSGEGVPSIAP